jgi:hypothetical protein
VGRRHDGNHAGPGAHLAQIEAAQPAALDRWAADRDMLRADRFGDVIDIFGAGLHILGAAVVRQPLVNVALRRLEYVAIHMSDDLRRA